MFLGFLGVPSPPCRSPGTTEGWSGVLEILIVCTMQRNEAVKEVLAVIRMNKMNETKQALVEAGIASFTARKVVGRGKGKVDYLLLKGRRRRP